MLDPALSTMWMQNTHQSLAEFFDAAQEIGFETFELNRSVTQALLEGTSLPPGAIPSVHAPCPTNADTEGAQISAIDKEERAVAIEAVAATIRLAEEIGAGAIILHPGGVDVSPELERELRALYDQGHKGSDRYDDLKAELVEARARNAERYLDATRWSLDRLAGVADSAGVRIGLENRFAYREIPLPHELDLILQELAGPVGFWFDTGHAYVQEALGFVHHAEWLDGFGEHLIGVHLHDVQVVSQPPDADQSPAQDAALRDHIIPGTGVVDFPEVLRSTTDSVLVTCEFDWYHSPEQVSAGLDHLREIGFGKDR
ncbi:MAG: sugar phosphate isomerase/epimerase [Ardenticatenia bacterium]|nr:sugar phosphate isomerase/epimerase [Ardenticatenia bacterium]